MSTDKMPTTMKLCVDKKKESVMEDFGCEFVQPSEFNNKPFTYTYTNKPFARSKIDHDRSRTHAQNRVNGKTDPQTVARYQLAMRNGNVFPALVCFDYEGHTLKADGFHTDEAMQELGVEYVEGIYFFSHPDPFNVAAAFNTRSGYGESIADITEKAVRLYNLKKKACEESDEPVPVQADWARLFLLPEEHFNKALRRATTAEFLSFNDIKTDKIKHLQTYEYIHKVRGYDESAAVEIARLVANYQLPAIEVEKIVSGYLDSSKSAEAKKEFLRNAEIRIKRTTNNGKSSNPKGRRKNRSPEQMIKDGLITLSKKLESVDVDKFQKMIGDDSLRTAIVAVSKFIKSLK